MNIFQAAIMGLVQGLAEFLPISSSGHLQLASALMKLETAPMVFEIVVHVGTLVAVIIVFRKDIWNMIKHPLSKPVLLLVVATIPTVIFTLLFKDTIEKAFDEAAYLGISFILTALILIFSEVFKPRTSRKYKDMTYKDAGVMGVMQCVALFPGISRSGSTIAGGLVSGINRQLAARFAFLMSIPAILGSVVFKFDELKEGMDTIGFAPLAVGAIVAAVSGYLAIKFMLHIVRKQKLYGFAIYVAIIGLLVLMDQYIFHIFFTTKPF